MSALKSMKLHVMFKQVLIRYGMLVPLFKISTQIYMYYTIWKLFAVTSYHNKMIINSGTTRIDLVLSLSKY